MTSYEHKVQNIYLGKPGWRPGENTVAYYPLEGDTQDHSGNNHNGSWISSSYQNLRDSTQANITTLSLPGNYNAGITVPYSSDLIPTPERTYSIWFKTTNFSQTQPQCLWSIGYDQPGKGPTFQIDTRGEQYHPANMIQCMDISSVKELGILTTVNSLSDRHHMLYTYKDRTAKLYFDGVLVATENLNSNPTFNTNQALLIGSQRYSSYTQWYYPFYGYLSRLIIEKKERTAEEVENYFNGTKSNYGIS